MKIEARSSAGADVVGVDLRQLDAAGLDALKAAFATYGLLIFHEQQLSEQDHIAVAERFGRININRFFESHPAHPEIAMVRKEREQLQNIGGGWHTDHSYDQDPALGSILVARELPETGGDTLFLNTSDAFDRLSPGFQTMLRGLRAVHSAKHIFGVQAATAAEVDGDRLGNAATADGLADVVHPVVVRHPLSGRPTLYVNPAFTLRFEGWTDLESEPLLRQLYAHTSAAPGVCRVRWAPGMVAFWDNRSTWHYAVNDYHGQRREMHRITLDGCALEAA